MAKTKTKYPEVANIKSDIESLKENTIELGKHVQKDGAAKTEELKEEVSKRVGSLSEAGQEQLKKVETKVKENPLQSMAVAFAAGLAVSVLMGRR